MLETKTLNITSEWITIKSESDLPPDDYFGKVEFKIKGGRKIILGYYEEVYQTFEDDGTNKKNTCCVFWDDVDSYRFIFTYYK